MNRFRALFVPAAVVLALVPDVASGQVTLALNNEQTAAIRIVNQCSGPQSFVVRAVPDAAWIRFTAGALVQIPGGGTVSFPFLITTKGDVVRAGDFNTTLTVECTTCAGSVPPCIGGGKFPISLSVPRPPGSAGGGAAGSTPPEGGGSVPPGEPGGASTPAGGTPGTSTPGGSSTPSSGGGGSTTRPPTIDAGTPGSTPGTTTTPGATTTTGTPGTAIPETTGGGSSTPLLPLTLGGLILGGLGGLLFGSGTPGSTTTHDPIGTTTRDPASTPTASTPASTPAGHPQSTTRGGETMTPGTWDAALQLAKDGTAVRTTPGSGGASTTTRTTPGTTPGTTTIPTGPKTTTRGGETEAPGSWSASLDTTRNETNRTATTHKPDESPRTQVRTPGTWNASLELGAAAAPAADALDGMLEGFAGMGTPQPGERNSGGGQTFVRGGESPEELARANRPVTPEELERVRREIGTGPNTYDERERKLRDGMRRLREAQDAEATRPHTQTRAPRSHDLQVLYDDFNETMARIKELEKEQALPPNPDLLDRIVNFFSTMNFSSYDELTHLRAILAENQERIRIYEAEGADAVNEHDDVEKRKFMIQFGGEIMNQGLGAAGGDIMHVAGQTMEALGGTPEGTQLRPPAREPEAPAPVEPEPATPTRSRRNPELNSGRDDWQALRPEESSRARPGRMHDEMERPRMPGEMAPSVQEGPTCAPTSIADAMRSQGRNVTANEVIEAGHRAAANDPTLTPPNSEGWMTRDTRKAAAAELGFHAEDASFQTVDQLKTLRDQGEVVVSVHTVSGGAHAMRVVSVDPAPASVRNAPNPADRTLGTVTLADTNPSRVPGQDGGRTVTISYEDFFQQTKSGDSRTEGYAMTIRPQGDSQ